VEESIVRRELADNFCFYNENYDNINGISEWARESLLLHAADKREHVCVTVVALSKHSLPRPYFLLIQFVVCVRTLKSEIDSAVFDRRGSF
jgi:hypothetical protein